jgi:hypothetical protein
MNKLNYLKMLLGGIFCLSSPLSGEKNHPFNYDLHLTTIPGTNSKVMIVMHGMGSDYHLTHTIKEITRTNDTLIGFNFPDHGTILGEDLSKVSFGTVDELLPALFVMKNTVIDKGYEQIHLYGFSAGGGVIINLLEALNSNTYDSQLRSIGIGQKEKKQINDALQKGVIILDAPLKSIEEIIAYRGGTRELSHVAQHYRDNKMEPIETLNRLNHLSYEIIVYFEKPDEILSNRDDNLFFERLKKANSKGNSILLVDHTQGHNGAHMAIWRTYSKMNNTK